MVEQNVVGGMLSGKPARWPFILCAIKKKNAHPNMLTGQYFLYQNINCKRRKKRKFINKSTCIWNGLLHSRFCCPTITHNMFWLLFPQFQNEYITIYIALWPICKWALYCVTTATVSVTWLVGMQVYKAKMHWCDLVIHTLCWNC